MFAEDSTLYRFGSWLANLFILNTLWALFSLPIFTIGASTTAAFYVGQHWARGKEPPIWEKFWTSFRQNFMQATLIWFFFGGVGFMLLVNIQALFTSGSAGTILSTLQIVAFCELALGAVYAFSLLARFHMKTGDCLRSSFLMIHRHLQTSVSILALLIVLLWLAFRWPSLILLAIALFVWGVSFLQIKVFARYEHDSID